MIDLARSPTASILAQTVPTDPGRTWIKDASPAIDVPPDSATAPAPEGRWPQTAPRGGLFGAVTPRILALPGGGYRLYYTQILPRAGYPAGANDYENATTRILSATSLDGAGWTPEAGVRLAPDQGGGNALRVVSAEVVPTAAGNGWLRMFYEYCPSASHREPNTIHSAISSDGLTWEPEPGIRLGGDGHNYAAPRILFLPNGDWRLLCCERGKGIISAISSDGGLTFHPEPGVRIAMSPNHTHSPFAPEVLRVAGGPWVMYYAQYQGSASASILRATSADGLTWHPETAPVIVPGGSRWDAVKCSEMGLYRLPDAPGKKPGYRLLYEACDGTAPQARGVWRIAGATSAG